MREHFIIKVSAPLRPVVTTLAQLYYDVDTLFCCSTKYVRITFANTTMFKESITVLLTSHRMFQRKLSMIQHKLNQNY